MEVMGLGGKASRHASSRRSPSLSWAPGVLGVAASAGSVELQEAGITVQGGAESIIEAVAVHEAVVTGEGETVHEADVSSHGGLGGAVVGAVEGVVLGGGSGGMEGKGSS
jgi:hypothetical protein